MILSTIEEGLLVRAIIIVLRVVLIVSVLVVVKVDVFFLIEEKRDLLLD